MSSWKPASSSLSASSRTKRRTLLTLAASISISCRNRPERRNAFFSCHFLNEFVLNVLQLSFFKWIRVKRSSFDATLLCSLCLRTIYAIRLYLDLVVQQGILCCWLTVRHSWLCYVTSYKLSLLLLLVLLLSITVVVVVIVIVAAVVV